VTNLGERVKIKRESLKLTQEQLANALGLTSQYISAIEQNKRIPSLQSLVRLANELGTSADYLISGTDSAIADIVPAIKADKTLNVEVKKALVTLINALRKTDRI
jgi:transcriptional regulator with XRE-family HTH domain